MTPGMAAELAALDADFPPWRAWVSTRGPLEAGPVRVCATRVLPVRPCAPGCARPDHSVIDGRARRGDESCGETVDAATPAHMRALLDARRRLAGRPS